MSGEITELQRTICMLAIGFSVQICFAACTMSTQLEKILDELRAIRKQGER